MDASDTIATKVAAKKRLLSDSSANVEYVEGIEQQGIGVADEISEDLVTPSEQTDEPISSQHPQEETKHKQKREYEKCTLNITINIKFNSGILLRYTLVKKLYSCCRYS